MDAENQIKTALEFANHLIDAKDYDSAIDLLVYAYLKLQNLQEHCVKDKGFAKFNIFQLLSC